MRLVTWNCRGAFYRKHALAAALHPDILIVPECERLSGIQQPIDSRAVRSFEWFGTNPRKGMAVLSYGDYNLEIHPSYDPSHQWIVPLTVSGPTSFVLFAVWTLPRGGYSGRYVRPLLEAFESYKELMTSSEAIWAGDFNSNFIFDRPSRRYKFRDFVALLGQNGFHSLYHHQHGCEHGEEPHRLSTFTIMQTRATTSTSSSLPPLFTNKASTCPLGRTLTGQSTAIMPR